MDRSKQKGCEGIKMKRIYSNKGMALTFNNPMDVNSINNQQTSKRPPKIKRLNINQQPKIAEPSSTSH